MKKNETKNNRQNAFVRRPQTVNDIINRLNREAGREGGSIFLADLCAQVPNIPRAEVIQTLKNSNAGAFIVGRRGGASRWVYGEMAKNLPAPTSSVSRAEIGGRRTYRRATGETPNLEVRVTMGNKTLIEETVPLHFKSILQPV